MQGEDFYTVEEAARALKLTPNRIQQMLSDGELEGVSTQEGGLPGWKIPVRVIHGRDRPPPIDLSASPAGGPETSSGSDEISGPEAISEEEEPGPTSTQPQRDDDPVDSRESIPSSTHRVTVQDAARILQQRTDALQLEAKDEVISDLRDRVAFLERQLEDRAEEIRRRDHIIAALTERIAPAIEAREHENPPGARESTAGERAAPRGAGGPQTGSDRSPDPAEFPPRGPLRPSWWKRVFRR